jgi:hypothetical protein
VTSLTETPTDRCSVIGVTTEALTAVAGGVREHRRVAHIAQLYVDCEIVTRGGPPTVSAALRRRWRRTLMNGRARTPCRRVIWQGVDLPAETPGIDRKTEDLSGGELTPEPSDLQVLLTAPADFAHNSGG